MSMAQLNPTHPLGLVSHGTARRTRAIRPEVAVALLALAAAIPGIFLLHTTPPHLWQPALSAACLLAAAALALTGWVIGAERSHGTARGMTVWDAAGIYAFIGAVVGMFIEPGELVQFVGLS
jgi:hypothetical protein